eukprot:2402414-Rhodomonas_salina.1
MSWNPSSGARLHPFGLFDDLKLWGRALQPSEIAVAMETEGEQTGLHAYSKFDDRGSSTAIRLLHYHPALSPSSCHLHSSSRFSPLSLPSPHSPSRQSTLDSSASAISRSHSSGRLAELFTALMCIWRHRYSRTALQMRRYCREPLDAELRVRAR